MKKLTAKLKEVLGELARANGGEMLSSYQKARLLQGAPQATLAARPARREVALAIGTLLSAEAMRYAISVCQRLDATLYVLAADIDAANAMLDPWRKEREAAGVACCIEVVATTNRALSFFSAHPRVAFAIAGGYGDPLTKLARNSATAGRKSPVPIVVVGDGHPATPADSHPAELRYALAN